VSWPWTAAKLLSIDHQQWLSARHPEPHRTKRMKKEERDREIER